MFVEYIILLMRGLGNLSLIVRRHLIFGVVVVDVMIIKLLMRMSQRL
jgi:hypothetical protein